MYVPGMCCMHLHHTLQILHICTYINMHTYAYYIIIYNMYSRGVSNICQQAGIYSIKY